MIDDVEERFRTRLAAQVNAVVEGARRPPVSVIHDAARRRRGRRRTQLLGATAAVVVACAGSAVWLTRGSDRHVVSTDADRVVSPVESRLFPSDTNGGEITVLNRPAATSDQWPQLVVTQLWTADDGIVLAIRSGESGFSDRYGALEHVDIAGWPGASIAEADDGLLSLYLVTPDLSLSHVATRSLDRGRLIALASSMTAAADGVGVVMASDSVPDGWVEAAVDVVEIAAPITFTFTAIGTQRTTFSLRNQSNAGREFDRYVEPSTSGQVHEFLADVRTGESQTSITWMPMPGVQAVVTAQARSDLGLTLAQRIADSVEPIDDTSWRALLDTQATTVDTDATVVSRNDSTTTATEVTTAELGDTDNPSGDNPGIDATNGIALTDWIEQQEAVGRTEVTTLAGDGTDANMLFAYAPGQRSGASANLLLGTGRVVELPQGITAGGSPTLVGFAGQPAIVSTVDGQLAWWILDPATNSWSAGPELGVFHDPQSSPFVAVLDGMMIVANQTGGTDAAGLSVRTRFEGVIVGPDLQISAMSAPPAGQFLMPTSLVGSHALTLGRDSAAETIAPLTQPLDFNVRTNSWTQIPQPEWLDCAPGCHWAAPHEFGDIHLEVVTGNQVVIRVPDGSVATYDPETQTWTRLQDAPFELVAPFVAVFADQLAVVPMFTGFGANEPGVVGVLDLKTGTWTTDRVDVGDVEPGNYITFSSRTNGDIGLFAIVHSDQPVAQVVGPDFAFDPTTRRWRDATDEDALLWNQIGPSRYDGKLRDLHS